MTNDQKPIQKNLDAFLKIAHDNESQTIDQHPQIYALMIRIQQSFEALLQGSYAGPPTPVFLVLTAQSYFLAGVRTALAGQMPPVFPVLRAGLESVLFALIMIKDQAKEEIWSQRSKSKSAESKCRNTFTAKNGLNKLMELDIELYNQVNASYSKAIDSGAHPNVGAVYPHMNIGDAGESWLVQMRFIHPSDSLAVFHTMAYTVSVGAYILAIASHVMGDHPPANTAYNAAHTIAEELEHIFSSNNFE